eukprot:SAG31_NODE_2500_length_5595_cov_4.571143_5_plen_146_part_00
MKEVWIDTVAAAVGAGRQAIQRRVAFLGGVIDGRASAATASRAWTALVQSARRFAASRIVLVVAPSVLYGEAGAATVATFESLVSGYTPSEREMKPLLLRPKNATSYTSSSTLNYHHGWGINALLDAAEESEVILKTRAKVRHFP